MTEALARGALSLWDIDATEIRLIAQRENIVFRVDSHDASYALRLHRPGYQTPEMMRSELAWVDHLRASGIRVPKPVPARDGGLLHEVDGFQADVLTWLPGRPMGATGEALVLDDRTGTFRQVGALMAKVHSISDAWDAPNGFVRKRWDLDGLLGEDPLWGRFWDNPGLTANERIRVMAARNRLCEDLEGAKLDIGLIHADMLRENVMIDGDEIGVIDFDDSGFGYRLFDVATALFKNKSEPDFPQLQAAFLEGYRAHRPIDTSLLPQFVFIRALSYLGWIITRMQEPGAAMRQARFLSAALPMLDDFVAAD